jgi:hypothetical protein
VLSSAECKEVTATIGDPWFVRKAVDNDLIAIIQNLGADTIANEASQGDYIYITTLENYQTVGTDIPVELTQKCSLCSYNCKTCDITSDKCTTCYSNSDFARNNDLSQTYSDRRGVSQTQAFTLDRGMS